MKKPLLVLTAAALMVALIFSCAKEDALENKSTDGLDRLEAKVGPPPDLIIASYFTDISFTSTLCTDTLMLTTHCDFGDSARTFTASVQIQNIGTGTVPAGTIDVNWSDFGFGTTHLMPVPHNGLPPQGILIASRSYYVGPCDCVSQPSDANCFIHSYAASVDPLNLIAESNEMNNNSEILDTCDGCGPCESPVPVEL